MEKQSIYRVLKWKIGRVKALGMEEYMGSGSIWVEAGIKRGLVGDLSLKGDGFDRRGASAAVGSGSMARRRSRRISFATRS